MNNLRQTPLTACLRHGSIRNRITTISLVAAISLGCGGPIFLTENASAAVPVSTFSDRAAAAKSSTSHRRAPRRKHPQESAKLDIVATSARPGSMLPWLDADVDAYAQEKLRFDAAKAKAMNDPQVKTLKIKADSAMDEEEYRQAAVAYNKALFGKVRKIDRTVADRTDRMEGAILKRIYE